MTRSLTLALAVAALVTAAPAHAQKPDRNAGLLQQPPTAEELRYDQRQREADAKFQAYLCWHALGLHSCAPR